MSKERVLFFPEFPANTLSLGRGTILVACENMPEKGVKKGEQIVLGYDGEKVRCADLSWSMEELEQEIWNNLWRVTNRSKTLHRYECAVRFITRIEKRNLAHAR